MIARQQHLRHAPASVLGWAGVVGVLGRPAERGAERLFDQRAIVAKGTRELAQHRVAHHHRGQLSAGEDVAADRQHVAGEVLDDALVEALVAGA